MLPRKLYRFLIDSFLFFRLFAGFIALPFLTPSLPLSLPSQAATMRDTDAKAVLRELEDEVRKMDMKAAYVEVREGGREGGREGRRRASTHFVPYLEASREGDLEASREGGMEGRISIHLMPRPSL